jgi:energy-coupling factor transporter ATP-binding protein EcfA2
MSRSYEPLIHPDQIGSQVNSFAGSPAISDLFNRCFDSDILPNRARFPRKFSRNDVFANLYSSKREWRDHVAFKPDEEERHEKYLDDLFWDEKLDNPMVCIVGPVGSGKSTLVDFYLRCYCHESGLHSKEFDKKLIVYFDSGVVQDNTDFYHLFFLSAQSSIRKQCRDRLYDIDDAITRRPTQPNNVREWVWAAFEELSHVAGRKDSAAPFKYIALAVDNLDQTPPTVQIRAITEVEQWLNNPLIQLWRVFLPLWPSTFSYLRNHRFNMLRGVKVFEVGPLDSDALVTNHQSAIEYHLKSSRSNLDQQAIDYISETTQFARKRLLRRIVALSHGSLRLMLSLWGGFLRSAIAHSIWRQWNADPNSQRGYEYELLDALIVGASDALNQRRHRIANVFAMGHAHDRPRDLLIGPHILFLMHQGMNRHSSLSETLLSLGYSPHNIHAAVMAFSAFNVLHLVPTARIGSSEFELHDPVIAEYLELIWEPAYIDNVAMVTHVDPGLRSQMHKTRGDRPEDFTHRVETTLVFLEFLRSCEESFRDPSQLRPGVDPNEFRMSLTKLKVRCLWRGMAVAYRARLTSLKRGGYLKNVDPGWWSKTLNDHPVFLEIEKTDELLTPL